MAKISAPYMYDAAGAKSTKIEVSMQEAGGGKYRLTYVPDDAWLADEARVYPVVLDPTITIDAATSIEDNYTGSGEHENHPYDGALLYAGNKNGKNYTAYARPAFPDDFIKISSQVIIQDAKVKLYVTDKEGNQDYKFYRVKEEWSSRTITNGNKPSCESSPFLTKKLSKGANTIDIKPLVSKWFNCLDQKENCGFAIKGSGTKNASVDIASSDYGGDKSLEFSITYKKVSKKADTGFTVTPKGGDLNSGVGYVDLSWKKMSGVESYYVGIFNGKDYEYFFVGDVTSYSTRGKGIWPTAAEIASGKYALHGDGKGADLPCIPADSYGKVPGGKHASDLNYYFVLVPANSYGQAINPGTFEAVHAILPDRIPPNQATAVTVMPSTYTNGKEISVSYSGVRDFTTAAATIQDNLGSGCIQYSIDGTSNWKDTAQRNASGTIKVPVNDCADGQHTIYLRGKDAQGNTGMPKGAYFYIDRTGPEKQTLLVLPEGWTSAAEMSLSWSGMQELNSVTKIEYRIDGESWQDTGRKEKAYAGFAVDISHLEDGEHTVELRGTDNLGNIGAAKAAAVKVDRTAPQIGEIEASPSGWNNEDVCLLSWDGVTDAASGVAKLEYALDGEWTAITESAPAGSVRIDLSSCADGEHTVSFRATDNAGNVSEIKEQTIFRDTSAPKAQLTSPADNAIVDGVFEISGEIEEEHLKKWTLTAKDSAGNETVLAEGGAAVEAGVLAQLDAGVYPDGENITIVLTAEDEAGNQSVSEITVIYVGGAMEAFRDGLTLTTPEKMVRAQEACSYAPYQGETSTRLYIDGEPVEYVRGGSFPVDAVRYAEGSVHTAAMVSQTAEGKTLYSKGLGALPIFSKLWEESSPLEDGAWVSECLTTVRPMLALRLDVTEHTPGNSSISYEYSTDGNHWEEIVPGKDAVLEAPAEHIYLRARAVADGAFTPKLYRLEAQGVIDKGTQTFLVKLEKQAESFRLQGADRLVNAKTPMKLTLKDAEALKHLTWYISGQAAPGEGSSFDARYVPEGGSKKLAGAVNLGDTLYLTEASADTLLREAVDTGEKEITSASLSGKDGVAALRMDAAVRGGKADFAYRADGGKWKNITPGETILLDKEAEHIQLKAKLDENARLTGWYLQGYRAKGRTVTAKLSEAPVQVLAKNYGGFAKERYELSWKDAQAQDGTAKYAQSYRIYRDGVRLAETAELSYTDNDYRKNASYTVAKVRTYEGGEPYQIRESDTAKAAVLDMKEAAVKALHIDLETFDQPEQLTSLYGGNPKFVLDADAPSADLALNQSLLGKNKYCALGFEPVNFNTGNFVLEAMDAQWQSASGSSFEVLRTYNTQSTETDGPFGAKWASGMTRRLQMYQDGTIGYRKADGALVLFSWADGGYLCDIWERLELAKTETGYALTEEDGTVAEFDKYGLLSAITSKGQTIWFLRDGRNVLEKVCLPGDAELALKSDALGHITEIIRPDGQTFTYEYDGNHLISVTDASGAQIRYEYDEKGRMTEWYDRAGNRQVYNEYDEKDRVTYQMDALSGEYTLEYFEDHTIVTDAEGKASEVWFDEKMRTTKEVDANGGEYLYAYDEDGNLTAKTDAAGQLTSCVYDGEGRAIEKTMPDGSKLAYVYDADGNLTGETDANGNTTRYEYDKDGRCTKTIYADGAVEEKEYDADGRLLREINALGGVTEYSYDGELVSSVTAPDGGRTSYTYDAAGNVLTETDALGNAVSYTYDAAGNVLTKTDALGNTVSYTYDAVGNMASQTDARKVTTEYRYDALYNCVEVIYPDGTVDKREYTPNGNIAKEIDTLGNAISYTYDAKGNQLTKTDALGNTTSYAYDAADHMVSMTLPQGATATYLYDELTGNLAETVDISGMTTQYVYDEAGNVTEEYKNGELCRKWEYDSRNRISARIFPDGSRENYQYDPAGNLVRFENANGSVYTFTYDKSGKTLSETDALGGKILYEYDLAGNLVKKTDCLGGVTLYAYDAAGNMASETNALGHTTSYEYDANGNVTKKTDALGGETRYEYDLYDNPVKIVQPDGGECSYTYDAEGRILTETDANGNTSSYTYDAAGQITDITDEEGDKAELSYDADGNLTEAVSGGLKAQYAYNKAGQITRHTDENGKQTEYAYSADGVLNEESVLDDTVYYTYDVDGNIVEAFLEDGSSVSFVYDAYGQLLNIYYPDGSVDTYEYDELGRLVYEENREGCGTEYEYDAAGNLTAVWAGEDSAVYGYDLLGQLISKEENGMLTEYTYDRAGNLISEADGLGNTTGYAYDAAGNTTRITYPNGKSSEAEYDLNGNVVWEKDAAGNESSYEYDALGNLIKVTDALGGETSYRYNAFGEVMEMTDALGRHTLYGYDNAGNVVSERDALGNVTEYAYTPEGWMSERRHADGSVTTYRYDAVGNLMEECHGDETVMKNSWNGWDALETSENAAGRMEYSVDDYGRLAAVEQPGGEVVSYEYDDDSHVTKVIYPDGGSVAYAYDTSGRVAEVTGRDGSVTSYRYDALGRLAEEKNEKRTTAYTYDEMGWLSKKEISGDVQLSFAYTYNGNGNILQETRTENGETNISSYGYDPLGRLISFQNGEVSEEYRYDAAGNMTEYTRTDADGTHTALMDYNEADQLVARHGEAGTVTYVYNERGDLTEKKLGEKTDIYCYDSIGLLVSYEGYDGYRAEYVYTAADTLLEKRESGQAERLTLEELSDGKVLTKHAADDAGSEVRVTTYVQDVLQDNAQVLAETKDGQTTYYEYGNERLASYAEGTGLKTEYLCDGMGSVAVTAAGGERTSYAYFPYGEQMTGIDREKQSGYTYNAELYDAATGMVYLRARWYEPAMMRFSQKDKERGDVWEPESLNCYAYAADNPVMLCDPSGRTYTQRHGKSYIPPYATTPSRGTAGKVPAGSGKTSTVKGYTKTTRYHSGASQVTIKENPRTGQKSITVNRGTRSYTVEQQNRTNRYKVTSSNKVTGKKTDGYVKPTTKGKTPVESIEEATRTQNKNQSTTQNRKKKGYTAVDNKSGLKPCRKAEEEEKKKKPWEKAWDDIREAGKKAVDKAKAVGHEVANGAKAAGKVVVHAAVVVGQGTVNIIKKTAPYVVPIIFGGAAGGIAGGIGGIAGAGGAAVSGGAVAVSNAATAGLAGVEIGTTAGVLGTAAVEAADWLIKFAKGGGSKKGGDNKGGDDSSKNQDHMLGENGPQFESKTTWQNGKTERIDAENPSPGKRKGQIHYHEPNDKAWLYDVEDGIFRDFESKTKAPPYIQKKLKNKNILKGIEKALRLLGEKK